MEMSSVYACDSHARPPPDRPLAAYKDAICRGVWGHAPKKSFGILSLLRVVLRHSETILRS